MSRHTPTAWFTSDLHLGHEKVATTFRGFGSVEEHDAEIAGRWRDLVHPEDRVYVLGDVTGSASRTRLIPALSLLATLPGEKHLVAGNHDGVHPMSRPKPAAFTDYALAFASVQSAGRFKGFGVDVLLSHFPYTRDRDETRYPQWRLPNLGGWLLHGHTHGTERVTLGKVPGVWETLHGQHREHEIHVGVDAWDLDPVHVETVADLIKENS